MSVRHQDARRFRLLATRPVEIAAQIIARQRLDVGLFDGVIFMLDAPENHRMQRISFGQWDQSSGEQNLIAQFLFVRFPLRPGVVNRHGEMRVGIGKMRVPRILGRNLSQQHSAN